MSTVATPTKHQSTLFQLWFRRDIDQETARAHWLGRHAQLVAVTPGLLEYRQHHFGSGPGIWPAVEGVQTDIPATERIDGSPEATLAHALSPVLSAAQNRWVAADEANAFRRTIMNITSLRGTHWIRSGAGIGARTVVYLRSRSGTADEGFTAFVNNVLTPALEAEAGLLEIRVATYQPWREGLWKTPNVEHLNPPEQQFHGSLILGAADSDSLSAALAAVSTSLGAELRGRLSAVHAYPVSRTYVFRQDGRVTLPRDNDAPPRRKQRLHPERLILPPIPPRSSARTGSTPMGGGRLLPLPGPGPEHVIASPDGQLITGLKDGRIVLIDPVDLPRRLSSPTRAGRPLGMTLLDPETLLVCDAHRGLLSVSLTDGRVKVLVDDIDGVPLRFCSNAAPAPDGSIWFTESTHRYDYEQYLGAFLERAPTRPGVPPGPRRIRGAGRRSHVLPEWDHSHPRRVGDACRRDVRCPDPTHSPHRRPRRVHTRSSPGTCLGIRTTCPRSWTVDRGWRWSHRGIRRSKVSGSAPGLIPRTLWRLPERLSASGPTSAWVVGYR